MPTATSPSTHFPLGGGAICGLMFSVPRDVHGTAGFDCDSIITSWLPQEAALNSSTIMRKRPDIGS